MYPNNKKILIAWSLILQLFLLILPERIQSNTKGLDIVIIVDQSGSMMGSGTKANNDPEGMRNVMTHRIFDFIHQNGKASGLIHRLGVVSFGSRVCIDLPLSEITSSGVESLRDQLNSNLKAASLGNTHFLGAFEAARHMFDKGVLADPGKRVIILITDGAPYVEGINTAVYVKQLREHIDTSYPYPDFQIYVIALNDPSSDYWEHYRAFWRSVSHNQARKLEGNRKYIFSALMELMGDVAATPTEYIPPEMYNNLVIPPYLESVVFDIFYTDTDVIIEIFSADDALHPLSPDSNDVDFSDRGKTIRTISVRNPVPGRWVIKKSNENARVEIYSQKFFPRGVLISPASNELVRQYESRTIRYHVVNGDKKSIQEIPGYPLSLELSLVKPDSSRIQVEMQKDLTVTESIYKTIRDVKCDQPGMYHTEVVIASRDLRDKIVTIYRDQWSGFTVESSKLIDCHMISPKQFERIPAFGIFPFITTHPVHFKFEFKDEHGQPINMPAIFQGSESDVLEICTLVGSDVKQTNVHLAYQGNGILTGDSHRWKRPAQHRLKIRANRSCIPGHYMVRIKQADLTIIRYMSPLHWVVCVILCLIILVAIIFGGYLSYVKWRFPLKGTLYINRLGGAGTLCEYPLSSRSHRLIIKELPLQTQIKKIIIRSKKDKRGGIIVTVIGNKKVEFLKNRTLNDKVQTSLSHVPYVLLYKTGNS